MVESAFAVFPMLLVLLLIPLDLSFSCWFFFLFWKLQRILGSMAGLHNLPEFPYAEAQSAGSYICIGCIALWFCRRHFQRIWKSIVSTSEIMDIKEPMPYRLAVIGFLLGTFLLILFAHRAGMKLGIAIFFFSIYLLLSITITRMRAKIGHPAHELYWRGPRLYFACHTWTKRYWVIQLVYYCPVLGVYKSSTWTCHATPT